MSDPKPVSETPPVGDTSPAPAFVRHRDLPRLERVGQDLAAVEAALALLDRDAYGQCQVCGETIADARLAAFPATDDCGAHGTTSS